MKKIYFPNSSPSPRDDRPSCSSAGAAGGGDAPYIPGGSYSRSMEKRTSHHEIFPGTPAGRSGHYSGGGDNNASAPSASGDFMRSKVVVPVSTAHHYAELAHAADFHDAAMKQAYAARVAHGSDFAQRFSRKVFIGGLPPDIDEDAIVLSFRRFGGLSVDWPHKVEMKTYYPPKGFAFLLFHDDKSVQLLIDMCVTDEGKLYYPISSPSIKDKPVQVRPWRVVDADYMLDPNIPLDSRKTVFVGGVPRPLKAFELAMIIDRLYGGVCFASIDTDTEHKYPKGAGRVCFSNQQSYIAAISARFVQLQYGDIDKRVEVKPYVLDDQMCDECDGQNSGGKFAPFFCANVTCLQYYCEQCWGIVHTRPGREYHKPLVKEGPDRPRGLQFRWC